MITQNEISSLTLSPTNKDFVQIWNELLEVASKITERWDPTSTNESDPGIVLLKVLAGIADKLNYNIDKNILEAYMPTAAQMESMRKLCELVGYDIKYYQSATTKVRISYVGNTANIEDNEERLPDSGLALPKFTTITNADKDITFITTNAIPVLFTNETPWVTVECIEGQICQCESINEYNLITLAQLDENNRYYLPEVQIAENGIFVYNASESLEDGTPWEQVSNLNTRPLENRVFKFGYDSYAGRPYLAFPDDIGSLIGDGLFIYYTRTSGLGGNISQGRLEVIEIPDSKWGEWENYSAEQFEVVNADATSNGANIESISTAYRNFKKTVGTFDTLVTCRDYMNKIYSLMNANNLPYVSNILVTDIRNDINKAITLCSCNEFGILYKETPLTESDTITYKATTSTMKTTLVNDTVSKLIIDRNAPIELEAEVPVQRPLIDHFDLLLYPFKTFTQVSSGIKDLAGPYNKSFTYTEQVNPEIETALADFKTCAHNLTTPAEGDVVLINNYLRLNALIATSTRVSEVEANDILKNVRVALVNAFNLRNIDFGEEIPFDSILSVIEKADSRIKVVSLQEPTVLTTYSVKEGVGSDATSKEYGIVSTANDDKITGVTYSATKAKEIYNRLVLRNILAGRASLFNYDDTFIANNSEKPYTITKDISLACQVLNKITKIDDIKNLSEEDKAALDELIKDLVSANLTDTEIADELQTRFVELKSKADAIAQAANAYSTPGEHILLDSAENEEPASLKGPLGGVVTLKNIEIDKIDSEGNPVMVDKIDPETGKAIIDPDTGEPVKEIDKELKPNFYETFEPGFEAKSGSESPEKVKDNIIDDINRVEAVCDIANASESTPNIFQNVTLDKNEVIKFRAPNLITTTTYPAYVYYRFERANLPEDTVQPASAGASSGTATFARTMRSTTFAQADVSIDPENGSFANVMSLSSFINAYATKDGDVNLPKEKIPERLRDFFCVLWKAAVEKSETNKINIKTFSWRPPKDGEEPESSSSIQQSSALQNIFNTSIAIGTDEKETVEDTIEATKGATETGNDEVKVFTNINEFNAYLEEKAEGDKTIIFKYYPFWDSTMPVWSEHIRTYYEKLYKEESKHSDDYEPLPEGTTFWRLSNTSGHPKGKYVTESGQRLYAQGGDFLRNTVVGDTTYLCKILGEDPVFSSVPSGSDVELRPGSSGGGGSSGGSGGGNGSGGGSGSSGGSGGSSTGGGSTNSASGAGDRLFIHYTPSSTNEDGETVTAEPVSIVYESTVDNPIIIRPSGFTLMPSDDLVASQGISWKKTGVQFTLMDGTVTTKNLLALAPNEQIEMRDISRVVLDSPARFYKNFTDEVLESGDPNKHPYSYELKDGEYIFYTDQNTSDAAYYGSGSVITVEKGAKIPKATEIIEVSQILEQGLQSVPWSRVELLGGDKKVTVTEYQYVTLVKGDTLNSLTLADGGNAISSNWAPCLCDSENPIIYTPAGSETSITLPKINIPSEKKNKLSASWEVRSILELSTSPGYAQPLRAAQSNTASGPVTVKDAIKLHVNNETGGDKTITITPQKSINLLKPDSSSDFYEPVSIKLDTIAQVASGNLIKENSSNSSTSGTEDDAGTDTDTGIDTDTGVETLNKDSLRAKIFKEEAPAIIEYDRNQEITPISDIVSQPADSKNNITDVINNYWTKLDINNALLSNTNSNNDTDMAKALAINFMIPAETSADLFGIFSIYFDTPEGNLDSTSKQNMALPGSRVYIDIPKELGSYEDVINIYNYKKVGYEYSNPAAPTPYKYLWWSEGVDKENNRLYLRAGLNCILIKKSCAIRIGSEENAVGSLVYDNLRLLKGRKVQGINLDLLDFKPITEAENTDVGLSEAILRGLSELDKNHDFYYNVPIENSLAIEFDNNIKSFSNPYTLYDVNNVNNNFVISKLDVKYLGDEYTPGGLKIAKSSRY